ncbi:MAG: hypothetical protein RIC56_05540 [Pseudomonadales bacterium]
MTARIFVFLLCVAGLPGSAAAAVSAAANETPAAEAAPVPDTSAAERHASFDPAPDLQRTPGGNLIVNAFIMRGPVRVEIREQGSDRLLVERQSETLFPFELSHRELGAEPEQVVVHIYVDGTLSHELTLREAP